MKTAIIVFPGSNCDRDVAIAVKQVTGGAVTMVWHAETTLPATDLVILPGGFSYGDYLRSGAMAAQSPIVQDVKARAQHGLPVLGICNGFQILAEAGLLPGVLMRNRGLKFIHRTIHLKLDSSSPLFTNRWPAERAVAMPIAHADGCYFADEETLDALEAQGQIALRYCDPDGAVTESANPNGSARNIAGLFNRGRTVLGLMPHPERVVDPLNGGGTDGRFLFESLLGALS